MSMAMIEAAPTAVHRGDGELPWVDDGHGTSFKVVVAKEKEGLWIVHTRFDPGVKVQTHKHTGPVYGYTSLGSWHYLESGFVNEAGSFLYEPAGSIHTLVVGEDNEEVTEVWFQIYGANLNLDSEGNVESVTDAASVLEGYRKLCAKHGHAEPAVLTD